MLKLFFKGLVDFILFCLSFYFFFLPPFLGIEQFIQEHPWFYLFLLLGLVFALPLFVALGYFSKFKKKLSLL